ncbi:flagellar assembly protein T N-terminal domain-containing protein [Planktotalea sp.]|uniref:flagellar assembly protein T N-terminal domain-containing protein n=1 Tax=Planktotalea sp. TaxID=2029877 RepID=UPI003F6D5300
MGVRGFFNVGRLFKLALLIAILFGVPNIGVAEMVRVTGRAALQSGNEAIARRTALEDALYQASLAGGAELDGFTVADHGVLTGDTILLRPSSKILDFQILRETRMQSYFEVTIDAYVGDQPQLGCSARPDVVLTAVRPQIYASAKTPLWMQDALARAHSQTLGVLSKAAKVKIVESDIDLARGNARQSTAVQAGFDYQSLLLGGASKAQAPAKKLSANARALHLKWVAEGASMRSGKVLVSVEAKVVDPAAPSRGRNIRLRHTLKLSPGTPWRALNVVARKDQESAALELSKTMGAGLVPILEELACAPLVARLSGIGKKQYRVQLGARDGLTRQSLAFAEGQGQAWTVFRVVELSQSSAIVAPMNASRAGVKLSGANVRFNAGRP